MLHKFEIETEASSWKSIQQNYEFEMYIE